MISALFCLEIWGTDYNKIKETCLLAEKLGYHGFYYGESLTDIDLDCWTIVSNLSAMTHKIKLGPVITYILPQYRNISLLAKQALTVQEISNGRLEFRTGVGAPPQWASNWWHPYAIDYSNNAKRVSLFEEGMELLGMLWSRSSTTTTFNGQHFKVKDIALLKNCLRTKVIPITIAAKQLKTMQIAAKYAHIWECSYLNPEQFVSLNKKFENICKKTNQDEGRRITKSIELDVIISESDSDLKYKKKIFATERGLSLANQIFKQGLIGTPEEVRERLIQYTRVGVNQFLLAFHDPLDNKALELFVDTVIK
jgi:alkanesulfonate monooxygenase SsuD/methylene tetrahydromethanopterin reductase-like flavin-dependent oxidoreductase (luciferase family)